MEWNIELSPEARKKLSKIGKEEAKRVLKFLYERLRLSNNPRELGKALIGSKLGGFWRYRVGDYRIICRIEDQNITIVIVDIGHRKEVYK